MELESASGAVGEFSYEQPTTPDRYVCSDCGKRGVRLYREYQTFLEHQVLRCRTCALENQNRTHGDMRSEHSIGWLVAAVPCEDGSTFWGYCTVPAAGVTWWDRLPVESASFFLSLLDGVDIPDGIDQGDWGTRDFALPHGWKVSVFYDCGDLDYIDHFVSPSGKIVDFWHWPDSPDRAMLIRWRGNT